MNATIAESKPHGWSNIVTEYRIRRLRRSEVNELMGQFHFPKNALYSPRCYAIERRNHRDNWTTGNGERVTGEWQTVDFGGTLFNTALTLIGETLYAEGNSAHPLHKIVKRRLAQYKELYDRKLQLEAELNQSQAMFEDKYIAALKKERLYSKAIKRQAPQDKIDAIRAPLQQEAQAYVEARQSELEAIKPQLEELEGQFQKARS